jgi:ribosome-associated heat shock protein Hsp15
MRVDKYLWAVRLFKTRSLATKHCREGKVSIGGKVVKASLELKGQETIEVRKGAVHFTFEVIGFPKSRVGAPLVEAFVRDITSPEELAKLEQIRAAQRDLLRPVGRPTKRDRRDWERYFE